MPKRGLTEIIVIMDESGSMEGIKADAIGGFNSFLAGQKSAEGEAVLTLAVFDHRYRLLYDGKNIKDVEPLDDTKYRPSGWTALLDAIGNTIDNVNLRLADTPKDERPEKFIAVIITDGQENRSTKFTREQIANKVKIQKGLLDWEFIFLGANIDSFSESRTMGISSSNTANFESNPRSMNLAYSAVNNAVTSYRALGEVRQDWAGVLEEDKNEVN